MQGWQFRPRLSSSSTNGRGCCVNWMRVGSIGRPSQEADQAVHHGVQLFAVVRGQHTLQDDIDDAVVQLVELVLFHAREADRFGDESNLSLEVDRRLVKASEDRDVIAELFRVLGYDLALVNLLRRLPHVECVVEQLEKLPVKLDVALMFHRCRYSAAQLELGDVLSCLLIYGHQHAAGSLRQDDVGHAASRRSRAARSTSTYWPTRLSNSARRSTIASMKASSRNTRFTNRSLPTAARSGTYMMKSQ